MDLWRVIDVRRNTERCPTAVGDEHVRVVFGPQAADLPTTGGLGGVGGLSEIWLPAAGRFATRASEAGQTLTYVYSGALALDDCNGGAAFAYAGEFLRSALPTGAHDRELRASTTAGARVFWIALHRVQTGLRQVGERARFTTGQRRNMACAVASPDARDGSLLIRQDVVVCSSVLDAGHHFAYPVKPRRTVWVHLVAGSVTFGELVLSVGDSVGVTDEPRVSFVARQSSEILLMDVGAREPLERGPSQ